MTPDESHRAAQTLVALASSACGGDDPETFGVLCRAVALFAAQSPYPAELLSVAINGLAMLSGVVRAVDAAKLDPKSVPS